MGKQVVLANIFGYLAAILITGLVTYFVFRGKEVCMEDAKERSDVAKAIYKFESVSKKVTEKKFVEVLDRKELSCYKNELADEYVTQKKGVCDVPEEKKNTIIVEAAAKYIKASIEDTKKYDAVKTWVVCTIGTEKQAEDEKKCVDDFMKQHLKEAPTKSTGGSTKSG